MSKRPLSTPRQPPPVQLKGRSAAIVIAFVAFSMLTIAIGLKLLTRGEALSHRVVVGARGCGPSCDERLAHALSRDLRALGFDAVAPSGLDTPDEARAFARAHGARFAVALVLAVEGGPAPDEPPAPPPTHGVGRTPRAPAGDQRDERDERVGANAIAYVIDAASDDTPAPSYVLRGLEEGDDTAHTLQLLSSRLASGLFPAIASALLSSEPVRALEEHPSGLEQQAAALELKRKRRDLVARDQAMREYRLHCEHNDELLAEVEGGGRCVSAGCAEEYVVGLLPDGSAAVVHDSTDTPLFPLSPDSTARAFSGSEKLWLVTRDGARKLLAEAANFYSRPELSRDGRTLAFIEQRLGDARLYALSLETGRRRLLYRAAAPEHLSSPHLRADGKQVLFYEIGERGGPAALMLAASDDDSRPKARMLLPSAIDARFVELALEQGQAPRTWVAALVSTPAAEETLDAEAHAALSHAQSVQVVDFEAPDASDGPEGPRPELLLIDPHSAELRLRQPLLSHRVRALGDVYDGALLLTWQDTGCGFARFSPGAPVAFTATRLCPKHLAVGRGGVFAHALLKDLSPSRQLIRIDPATGGIEVLTKGNEDVQNPKPATNADGLAYERVLPRMYGELQNVAVCFDLP